jgi:hypothetical protein
MLAALCLGAAATSHCSEADRMHYLLNCAGCHQADGSGVADGSVPAFSGNLGYFMRIPAGRSFLVQVPGSAQSQLSDSELAGVLNWLLLQFCAAELPTPFRPFNTEEVSKLRLVRPTDVHAARAHIVTQLMSAGFPAR